MPHLIAEEGPLKGSLLKLEDQEEWILGRDPKQASFVLEDPSVSRKHAILFKREDGICVKNLSSTNPVLVNDLPIDTIYLLKEGDRLKIGQNIFLFSEETPSSEFEELKSKKEAFDENREETIFMDTSSHEKKEPTAYDTIFEEEYVGESPPSFPSKETLLLKVLSGPNHGAEFGMEKGKFYVIGKDPGACDIVFNDLSVSRKHAKISIDDDGFVYFEDLASRNGSLINGKLLKERSLISSQDLIAIGTTTFVVLDQKAQTETMYSPLSEPSYVKKETVEEIKKHPVSWGKQIIPIKHLVFAGSISLILLVSFFSFFSLFKAHKVEVVQKDEAQEIKEILKKYDDVQFSYNPKGENLFLVGHILTTIDKEQLLYGLKQLPYLANIEDNIIVDELVWKNMNDVLLSNEAWRKISIHAPKAGRFEAIGYVNTPDEASALSEYLNVNFPYVGRLENKVVIETILNAQISSFLISKGFSAISFQVISGELVLAGRYSSDDAKTFKEMLSSLKSIPGILSIKNLAIETTPNAARIDLSTKYTISGIAKKNNQNFSVIANGQIISSGDLLDGMKITSILTNTILLEKDGLKYKIDFNL